MQLKAGGAAALILLFCFNGIISGEIYEPYEDSLGASSSVNDDVNKDDDIPSAPSESLPEVDPRLQLEQIRVSKPLGEVSAVAIDSNGNLIAFHRGDRIWDKDSFTEDFKMSSELDVIKNSTIYVIEPSTGNVLAEHGENEYYMPHGMTVDAKGNIWVTDVGRHQVLRLCPKTFKPTLILGEKLVPGDDTAHFCQPTDVAVSADGQYIFVADGYCNARIMKFDSNGTFIEEFGNPPAEMPAKNGEFFVPHSIALVEDLNLLCVADRENQRIQCFSAGLSQGHRQTSPFGMFITKAENIGRVYAIREKRHYLVGITGSTGDSSSSDEAETEPQVFVINTDTGKAETYATGLNGHALAVDTNGNVFIAQMHPNQILHMQL